MQRKYSIAVLGIGGVGGFLGGKLAAAYSHSQETEVIFIARGAHAKAIKENGLKLITHEGEISAKPDHIVDYEDPIGKIDLLICCTKAYDLENSVRAFSYSITAKTIILPLLNGVDNTEKIQSLLPGGKVLRGCIYLVSKIIGQGIVQQLGEFHALHFGEGKAITAEMEKLSDLFQKAGINATAEANIHELIWSKFSFISPVATYTSAYNISLGKILESNEHTISLKKLMAELVTLAKALNIKLPEDNVEKNFAVMRKFPYGTTSSMQADFAGNRSTELETLTGYVVRKAAEQSICLDLYMELYEVLSERQDDSNRQPTIP